MWLNNCIGAANYRSFTVVITSVAVMLGIIVSTCVYLLVDYFIDEDNFGSKLDSVTFFEKAPKETFLGLLIVMTMVNLPLFVLDMQLVVLHAFLSSQHLTTYEYIMNKRSMEEEGGDDEDDERNDEQRTESKVNNAFTRRIKTLPRCMDWIAFARCGRGRRKNKNHIERIVPLENVPSKIGRPAGPEVLTCPEAVVTSASATAAVPALPTVLSAARSTGDSEDQSADCARSPPGSTVDTTGDVCALQSSAAVVQATPEDGLTVSSCGAATAGAPAKTPLAAALLERRSEDSVASGSLLAKDELLEQQKSSSDQDTTIADSSSTNGDDSAIGIGSFAPRLGCAGCDQQSSPAVAPSKI